MSENVAGFVLCLGVAALGATFGYLIRYRGHVELIAGYRAERVTDKAALARLYGNFTLFVAGGVLALGLALLVLAEPIVLLAAACFGACVLVGTVVVTVRGRRYQRRA